MRSPNMTVYPEKTTDSYVAMSEEDLLLITYDRSGPKSVEELLYEAASESNESKVKTKWEAFHKAVQDDYLTKKEIRKLIQDLDEQKEWSALHYAVANNNYFVVSILTGKTFLHADHPYKCDINILGGNGENILHVAAQSNKLWLKNDQSFHQRDQSQESYRSNNSLDRIVPNYYLSSSNEDFPPLIRILFDRYWFETGLDIDHEDDEGRTPLHLAAMANRYSFVQFLLKNRAKLEATTKLNANVFHFMFFPSEPMQTDEDLQKMFNLLIETAKKTNKLYLLLSRTLDNRSPLAVAVCHPKCTESIIKELMQNQDSNQLLLAFDLAAKRNLFRPDLSKLLFAPFRGSATDKKNILIQIACRHNCVKMLRWLAEDEDIIKRNNPNTKAYAGYTPLLTAVFYGAKECVEYLLKNIEIDWRHQNDDGETVLHILTKRESESETTLHILAKREDDPETILHIFAKRENDSEPENNSKRRDYLDLFNIIWTKMNFNEASYVMMIKDNFGNTPLHCAARSNQLELCKKLLGITDNKTDLHLLPSILRLINDKNSLGQTAVLVASDMGHDKIVEYFWNATGNDRNNVLFKRDDDGKTCLHLAAAKGHLNVVKYLVETIQMDIDIVADHRLTPLHLACQYGRSEVVKYLFEHKASPILRDARLYNCLEIAIINLKNNLVRDVIFNHPLWREMMRNAQPIKSTKAYDTPMRKLIRYMPEVTVNIIDNKLTRIAGGPEQKVFKRTYDYEFYQDELEVEQWYTQGTKLHSSRKSCYERYKSLSWTEIIRCACCCFCCIDPNKTHVASEPYTDDSYTLVRNHPLFIAAQQSSCRELIQHPYNICLRKKKFYMFGIYLLLLSCLLYTTYLGIFTAIILQTRDPVYYYSLINVSYTDDLTTCEYVAKTLANGTDSAVFKSDSYKILRWVAFAFLIVFIIKNIILMISLFPKLLRMGAYYLEISVLVLSFVYILDWYDWLNPVLLRCPVQYQVGSFGLLLAWINFLTYVRYLPIARIGIYVVMLQVIFFKFLQFFPVLLIIITGFGLTYWMLLQSQTVYKTPIEAIIRTGLMMFDLGYEARLYDPDQGGIGYYTILYVMFVLTAIVFAIFLINLMISLAVGELPSLNDQSVTWRHQMMYNLLSDYEILRVQLRPLVDCFTCGFLSRTKRRGPGLLKFLQRRQDVKIQRDENEVFWLLRFGRYTQKHFFDERIQDNINLPVDKKKKQED